MSDNSNNVIQFPGRKKEAEAPAGQQPEATQKAPPAPKKPKKARASRKTLAGTVLAVILATGAVNRYVFSKASDESLDLTSNSNVQRSLASVEKYSWTRDSAWEKQIAEKLASSQVRSLASTHIGRAATVEERLLWGTLEEKYTVAYKLEDHRIESLLLQDQASNPAYVLDRQKFLKEFGTLFESKFSSAKLKSVESSSDKTVEAYTLFDKEERATGEARFELDRHKRLLSLKVEPIQI
jgi:hypothetical protein